VIIAIDGPAGVGKSTLAKKCASEFSCVYINSGLLYRIVTIKASLRAPSSPSRRDIVTSANINALLNVLTPALLSAEYERYTHDDALYASCYTKNIDDHVGPLSENSKARAVVNKAIRLLGEGKNCVVEGRDVATVVYRDADLKIYLDADMKVRAERRATQRAINYQHALHNINTRDRIDREKREGALIIDKNAIVIDTTHLTFSEMYTIVRGYILKIIKAEL